MNEGNDWEPSAAAPGIPEWLLNDIVNIAESRKTKLPTAKTIEFKRKSNNPDDKFMKAYKCWEREVGTRRGKMKTIRSRFYNSDAKGEGGDDVARTDQAQAEAAQKAETRKKKKKKDEGDIGLSADPDPLDMKDAPAPVPEMEDAFDPLELLSPLEAPRPPSTSHERGSRSKPRSGPADREEVVAVPVPAPAATPSPAPKSALVPPLALGSALGSALVMTVVDVASASSGAGGEEGVVVGAVEGREDAPPASSVRELEAIFQSNVVKNMLSSVCALVYVRECLLHLSQRRLLQKAMVGRINRTVGTYARKVKLKKFLAKFFLPLKFIINNRIARRHKSADRIRAFLTDQQEMGRYRIVIKKFYAKVRAWMGNGGVRGEEREGG